MSPDFHFSPTDYPTMLEHLLAPSFEQLAGTTAEVDALARQLPLAEAAEILGPTYTGYLWSMCRHYLPGYGGVAQPAAALPYAEALIAALPDNAEAREIRLHCLTLMASPDYAAVVADCEWLTQQPILGVDYWFQVIREANPDLTADEWEKHAVRYDEEDRQRRTGHALTAAWAQYRLGELNAAAAFFTQAFALPPRFHHGFDWQWGQSVLPPVADADYLLWQLNYQLRHYRLKDLGPAVQDWLGQALRALPLDYYARFILG